MTHKPSACMIVSFCILYVYIKDMKHFALWEGQMRKEKNHLKEVRLEKMLSKAVDALVTKVDGVEELSLAIKAQVF